MPLDQFFLSPTPAPPTADYTTTGLPGVETPSGLVGGTTTALLTVARVYMNRFVVGRPMSFVSVAFDVTTAASTNDTVEVAVYDAMATQKLGTTGVVAGYMNLAAGTIGVVRFVAPINCFPGFAYYAGIVCPATGGTVATLAARSHSTNEAATRWGVVPATLALPTLDMWAMSAVASPLPNALQTISFAQNSNPILVLREY